MALALSCSLMAHAQYAPDYGDFKPNTWAFKGKVLPWAAVVVPIAGMNYTLGVEYRFGKANALGVDFVYNDNVAHKEYPAHDGNDSAGPNGFTVSRGVFLNYRRYLDLHQTIVYKPLRKLVGGDYLPYASAFVRYGKRDYHYDLNFETTNITWDEWQYSGGVLFGVVAGCFDVNMGPFYKQTYISDMELENGGRVLHSYMKPSLGFRVGVNVYLVAE